MALYYQGINGHYIGKCGTVVGYLWKQRPCQRAYRSHISYPNTPHQQRERDWFVTMVRFASKALPALKLGLCHKAAQLRMTEGNCFVMENKKAFHHVSGNLKIDYASICIAEGPAADVLFALPHFEEHQVVEVPFQKNSTLLRPSNDDRVYVYAYAPDLAEGYLSAPSARRSKRVRFALPDHWSGCQVHLYGFVVSKDGNASNSTYIGFGKVDCYTDGQTFVPFNQDWLDFVDTASRAVHPNTESPASLNAEASGVPQDSAAPASPGFSAPPGFA